MPSKQTIIKNLSGLTIIPCVSAVLSATMNYFLTPEKERDLDKSKQFGAMTMGALCLGQITHLVYNNVLRDSPVSIDDWKTALNEKNMLKILRLSGAHFGELSLKIALILAGAEAGKAAWNPPGQTLDGLKEDAFSFPIVLSISITAALLAQTLISPNLPKAAKMFIASALENIFTLVAGIPFSFKMNKTYLEVMPMLLPFSAAGLSSKVMEIGLNAILPDPSPVASIEATRFNNNEPDRTPLLSDQVSSDTG